MCIRVCIPKMPHNAWISPQAETHSARTFLKSVPLENRNVSARKKERVFYLNAIPSCWSLMPIFSFSISNWKFRLHALCGKSIGLIGHGTNIHIHRSVKQQNAISHIYFKMVNIHWDSNQVMWKRGMSHMNEAENNVSCLVILGDVEIANASSQHIRTFQTLNNWRHFNLSFRRKNFISIGNFIHLSSSQQNRNQHIRKIHNPD